MFVDTEVVQDKAAGIAARIQNLSSPASTNGDGGCGSNKHESSNVRRSQEGAVGVAARFMGAVSIKARFDVPSRRLSRGLDVIINGTGAT
jgi:hypothetical protein